MAGEGLDGIKRVPEREHQELSVLVDVAAEHPDAAIAGRTRVSGDARFLHVIGVGVAVLLSDRPFPDARNQDSSLTSSNSGTALSTARLTAVGLVKVEANRRARGGSAAERASSTALQPRRRDAADQKALGARERA